MKVLKIGGENLPVNILAVGADFHYDKSLPEIMRR